LPERRKRMGSCTFKGNKGGKSKGVWAAGRWLGEARATKSAKGVFASTTGGGLRHASRRSQKSKTKGTRKKVVGKKEMGSAFSGKRKNFANPTKTKHLGDQGQNPRIRPKKIAKTLSKRGKKTKKIENQKSGGPLVGKKRKT